LLIEFFASLLFGAIHCSTCCLLESLKVLIKTDDKATCKNFIDLIDELKIAEIGVIAPVDILASELELLNEKVK
jgi:hypothetical protein